MVTFSHVSYRESVVIAIKVNFMVVMEIYMLRCYLVVVVYTLSPEFENAAPEDPPHHEIDLSIELWRLNLKIGLWGRKILNIVTVLSVRGVTKRSNWTSTVKVWISRCKTILWFIIKIVTNFIILSVQLITLLRKNFRKFWKLG